MAENRRLQHERYRLVIELTRVTERPLIYLSLIWLVLVAVDLTAGLNRPLQTFSNVIWVIFLVDFILKFWIAPDKRKYLQHDWLVALSVLLPAFRLFRIFRALRLLRTARAARSLSLLRTVSSMNRGIRAVRKTAVRRGIGFISLATLIVILVGAAGMARFESPQALAETGDARTAAPGAGLGNYGDALWWTAMQMTTIGSDYAPRTIEGRILGWLLSMYAVAVFGYITASLASYFIGNDMAQERFPKTQ